MRARLIQALAALAMVAAAAAVAAAILLAWCVTDLAWAIG